MGNKKSTKYITYALYILYSISLILFLKNGEIENIGIAFFCLISTIALHKINQKNKRLINDNLYLVLALFIIISSLLGSCYDFYDINHYDDFLHIWSGLISCSVAYSLLLFFNDNKIKSISKIFIIIYLFMFSMGVASLWEIIEFLLDTFIGTNMQVGGLKDTVIDMIDALIGSLVMIPIIMSSYKKLNLIKAKKNS